MTDINNPEWTEEDFARAKGPESLPPEVLAAFPKTAARVRGPQKTPTKAQVTLRLDQTVIEHFKNAGRGWQSRINEVLLQFADHREDAMSMADDTIRRRIDRALASARREGATPVRISLNAEDMRAFEHWADTLVSIASEPPRHHHYYLDVELTEVSISSSSVDAKTPDRRARLHYPI